MQNQEQDCDRLTEDDVPRIRSQPRRKKRRVSKYEDEATTDDEEGIEEEGLEVAVKDVKGVEKGEEEMGGGKRRRKAKRFEDEDANDDEEDVSEGGLKDGEIERGEQMR